MSLSSGTQLGPYEIIAPLGAGGMGEVYRAKDSRLQRAVAIKVLPADLGTADRLIRFQQEARSASALNHPNIVTIYEIGAVDSVHFISMELVDGKSLRESLKDGPLSVRKLIQIASQIADGLSKAHTAGIVHRDLKPENIMISKDGIAKILDFGLAKLTLRNPEEGSHLETQTDAGTVLGTVGYMSPEQASGRSIDFRSDQFSFGAIVYEMTTGKKAFQRSTSAETLAAIIRDEPEPLAASGVQAPVPLRWIMERCLAKDPEDRYASTRDLARDLQSIRDHISDISSSTVSGVSGAPARSLKRFGTLSVLAIGLFAFVAGGVIAWRLFQSAPPQPMTIRSLTYSGFDSSPAVSADGRLVAFTSARDGQNRIWIRQMSGGNEVALTSGPDGDARFSPDGSTVLFRRTEGPVNSLYRVPVLGGEPRKIVDHAESGDWSPDGKRIVFVRVEATGGIQNSTIYIADADGSHIEQLIRADKSSLQWPRWSSDGNHIAATVTPPGNFKLEKPILIIDIKSKEVKWLSAYSTGYLSILSWVGNNQLLYQEQEIPILGDRGLRPGDFLLQNISSGKIKRLFWYPSMATSIQQINGDQLLFDAASARGNLHEFVVGSENSAEQGRWLTRGSSNDRQPKYSPDGEWVIFSSDRSGNMDLWEISTKNGAVRRLTDDAAQDWDPAFTPDGKSILWSSNRGGHFEIYIANADGSAARRLTSDGVDAENPTATPDGQWIVYGSFNPDKAGVWKVHPDGSGATEIFAGVVQLPELSPDGKYISVGVLKRNISEAMVDLRVLSLDGREKYTVKPDVTQAIADVLGGRSRWMPDGKRIAYIDKNEQGAWGVYVQDFIPGQDTLASRKPLAGFDPDAPTESFGISPDSSRVTICLREDSSGLVLAENAPLD